MPFHLSSSPCFFLPILPSRNSDPGSHLYQALPPPPHHGSRLSCLWRESFGVFLPPSTRIPWPTRFTPNSIVHEQCVYRVLPQLKTSLPATNTSALRYYRAPIAARVCLQMVLTFPPSRGIRIDGSELSPPPHLFSTFPPPAFLLLFLLFLLLLLLPSPSSLFLVLPGRFVDLATMAKVSVLILDEKYHGWYLHCRSPYPRVSGPFEANDASVFGATGGWPRG